MNTKDEIPGDAPGESLHPFAFGDRCWCWTDTSVHAKRLPYSGSTGIVTIE